MMKMGEQLDRIEGRKTKKPRKNSDDLTSM